MNKTSYRLRIGSIAKTMIFCAVMAMVATPLASVFADEAVSAPALPVLEQGKDQSVVLGENVSVDKSNDIGSDKVDSEVPAEEAPVDSEPVDSADDKVTDEKPIKEDVKPEAQSLGINSPSGSLQGISESSKTHLSPEIDSASGSLVYRYPISVPPGRNSMTPDVSLVYNSSSAPSDSIVGSGWDFSIPSIQRINKDGSNNLYSQNYYSSSIDGELISLGSGNYAAKNENGNFNKYSLVSNVWTITDKKGTVHKFGTNATERQDNSADTSKVYKWMIQESRDANDNYITYEYYKDAGQIYPSKIIYTGNGSTAGVLEVNFDRSSRTGAPTFYTTGFSVKSNYRITEIRTEVSDVWARKYTLAYTIADNASGSLLNTIVESGQDDSSTVTTLPAVDFNYNTSTKGWTYNSSWALPMQGSYHNPDYGFRMGDINGDGLTDIVCHSLQNNGGSTPCQKWDPKIYLNTGTGWNDVSSTWLLPQIQGQNDPNLKEVFLDSVGRDNGLRLLDINGDGLADLVRGTVVYINNGSGWTYNSSWALPLDGSYYNPDYGFRMDDINGDGLPDIVCHNLYTGAGSMPCQKWDPRVFLNNGSGWTDVSSTWLLPQIQGQGDSSLKEGFLEGNRVPGKDTGLRIVDVNGDGLADLVKNTVTYLNNGSGWIYNSGWVVPPSAGSGSYFNPDYGFRMGDINADGLLDIVCHSIQNNGGSIPCQKWDPKTFINNGSGWTDVSSTWLLPQIQGQSDPNLKEVFLDNNNPARDTGLRLVELNGDGQVDFVKGNVAYLNNESMPANLLTEIIYPQGGNTSVTYKGTPQFRNGSTILNPNMPMVLDVVSQITNSDGLGLTETYDYVYEGGKYYFNTYLDRKFSGFNKVIKTDSAGNKVINFYHQGNSTDTANGEYSDHISKMGKLYRTEIKDNASNIYSTLVYKWDKYDLGSGRNFVKNVRATELTYDGDSDHKDRAEEYSYDNTYGNLTQKIEYGEVSGSTDGSFTDAGTDKFTTDISYATNTTPYIVGLPSQSTVIDQSATKVNENKYYYDGQSLGSVTDGNLTKQEMWRDGSNYVDIEKTYNTTYGIVTQTKDQRDKATNYSYDSHSLYPTTITNPLSQATSFAYDYSSGQVKQVTDPNTRVYQTVYDGLDRPIEQKIPDLNSPSTLVTKSSNVYTDTSGSVKVKQTNNLDASNSVDTYAYFDGLGRAIQTRKEMENGSYATSDTIYNGLGQVYKQSLPYSSSGTSKNSPTTTTALLATNTYDASGRVASTVNAIGTTSSAYDDWKTTITDPRGKVKDLYMDAYGNLVRVDEHNSSSTYSTYYEYNGNNNLTKITDALGNIRNFTYDGLGRRLTAQDLHATSDSTFGSYIYTYDESGNPTSVVDPKSQTTNYTYDDTNRPLTEDYTGSVGTEVSYVYDSGTDGIGKLTSVTSTGSSSTYAYDPNGNQKQEVKTINSIGYQTDYTYDRQGNQLELTNPDSSKVKYTYNTAGQLETVQRKESTDASFANVVSNYDYGVNGSFTTQVFANGASTTNTYDAGHLYRLSNKTTTITGGSKMQDLTYTYDADNNVTKIVDASNTNSAKTVDYTYDDLNRLLSATASAVASGQATYTHNYTYDAIGNILTRTDASGTYSYDGNSGVNYANPHAVTSVGSVAYTYDNNGNMLTETGGLSNTWDYNNRLTQVVKGGITSTYTYDQGGQRVKLSNGTTTTYYPSDNYNTDGSTAMKHISANGQSVATVKGTGAGASVFYDHADHLTGSNVITNAGGTQEELMDYFPYGNIRIDQKVGSFDEQRKYTGHEYDVDTGLSYMEARYYNPSIGRFLSQDPVFWNMSRLPIQLADPQSWNSYTYARNNPIVLRDPDGQFWDTVVDLGFLAYDSVKFLVNSTKAVEAAVSEKVFTAVGMPNIAAQARVDKQYYSGKIASTSGNLGLSAVGTAIPFAPVAGIKAVNKASQGIDLAQAARQAGVAEVSPLLNGPFKKAATHVANDSPSRYPGMSADDIASMVEDTYRNATAKASFNGVNKSTGSMVNKRYYGGNGKVYIHTNGGPPTIFDNKNPSAYINRALKRDAKRYGPSR